ncbi:MAG: DUF5615 family PIN-like protein [Chloroflexi bacterium]|nr:DUF5615 family PIN-like protein [Chloroflexota bacterium]
MAACYLLDENVDLAYRTQLTRHDPTLTVEAVGEEDAPGTRTPDPVILDWCEYNDAWLVTNNRATMPDHLAAHIEAGRHVPGIFILNEALGLGGNVEQLLLIAGASLPDEWQDQIVYLPLR